MKDLALWVASAGLAFIAVFGMRVYLRFLAQLRTNHAAQWAALGSPKISEPEGSSPERALFMFIVLGHFKRLGDPVLNKCGKFIQLAYLVSLSLLGLLFYALQSS